MAILTRQGLDSMRKLSTNKTVGAISEIIDNSIQWKREDKDLIVNICFIQEEGKIKDIYISDNGIGMGLDEMGNEIIDYCLAFGGGTNRGASSGLGKFGMGLPFSSCSQTSNYHVYSWQDNKKIKHVYRNHEEFDYDEEIIDKPMETLSNFPDDIQKIIPDVELYQSGTVIVWKNCDSLEFKLARTLISKIEKKIGRIFRKFIDKSVKIKFLVYNKNLNQKGNTYTKESNLCKDIKKFDPLFLDTNTIVSDLGSTYATSATSELFALNGNLVDNSSLYFDDQNGVRHTFTITASIAKEGTQHYNDGEGNKKGAGNTPIGRLYEEVSGISLLRENRELALGRFGFPNLANDPRCKWMKVEVNFSAISDDLMQVNANKTNADNFRFLDNTIDDLEADRDDSDTLKVAIELSARVNDILSKMFTTIKDRGKPKCSQCGTILSRDGLCKNKHCGSSNICSKHGIELDEYGKCGLCEIVPPIDLCPVHHIKTVEGKCRECEKEGDNEDFTKEFIEELKLALDDYTDFENDKNDNKFHLVLDWLKRTRQKYSVLYLERKGNNQELYNMIELSNQDNIKIIAINTSTLFYKENIFSLREQLKNNDLSDETVSDLQEALDSIIYLIVSFAITVDRSVNKDRDNIFLSRFYSNLQELMISKEG